MSIRRPGRYKKSRESYMKLYVPTFYLLKSFLPKINLLYFFVALIKKPIRQM